MDICPRCNTKRELKNTACGCGFCQKCGYYFSCLEPPDLTPIHSDTLDKGVLDFLTRKQVFE
jgi:transcription elongation factor Elf1